MYRLIFASITSALCSIPVAAQAAAPASCPPDGPATIARSISLEKPPLAQVSRASGSVVVRVTLSATGELQNARVSRSSGNVFLDRGALDAVKSLVFAPGSQSCTRTGGSYDVEVAYPD